MIKYLGSKRALIPWIMRVVEQISQVIHVRTIVDPFSGSGRVAHAFKAKGYFVIAGDYATYAYTLAKALVEADARKYPQNHIQPILDYLNQLPPKPGWFTKKYAEESRFFQTFNASRIEAIRQAIDEIAASDEQMRAILLAALMLAADKVDSTTGVQMAYLKRWASRSYTPLRLQYPPLLPGEGLACQANALDTVKTHPADLVYLDPPYNQHSYLANYHIWETLILFDNPTTYGLVHKRFDVKTRKSPYNSRKHSLQALETLLGHIQAPVILLSFSNEGFHTEDELLQICRGKGYVGVLRRPYRRYVGAQIGIYSPTGEKVGRVSHLMNEEKLFVISAEPKVLEALELW